MSIICIYRVTVEIPDNVWERFHDTAEFDFALSDATRGNVGVEEINHYAEVTWHTEWHTYADACAAQGRMQDVCTRFAAKL